MRVSNVERVCGLIMGICHLSLFFLTRCGLGLSRRCLGPPHLGHAAPLTLPIANRIIPDWLVGGLPRECPEARRVMLAMAEESSNT